VVVVVVGQLWAAASLSAEPRQWQGRYECQQVVVEHMTRLSDLDSSLVLPSYRRARQTTRPGRGELPCRLARLGRGPDYSHSTTYVSRPHRAAATNCTCNCQTWKKLPCTRWIRKSRGASYTKVPFSQTQPPAPCFKISKRKTLHMEPQSRRGVQQKVTKLRLATEPCFTTTRHTYIRICLTTWALLNQT